MLRHPHRLARLVYTPFLYLTLAGSTLLLSACGGGSTDPLQSYREQVLKWETCDFDKLNFKHTSTFNDLVLKVGDRLSCTYMRAPLDYSQPERAEISIAIMKLAAGDPANRRGALLFNPGGPGEDGLEDAVLLYNAFRDSNPAHPQGARQLQLLNEFDMVGFSPRGTGASTNIQCESNALIGPVPSSAAEWSTTANLEAIHQNSRETASACLAHPLASYITTDATARDMDLMRGLLGDDKLNYVGYSYGTWLGAWYASLFPDKVGRMVLDSSADFTRSFESNGFEMATAQQRLFDEVLAPYAARHPQHFQLGKTDEEVKSQITSLSPRVQQVLSDQLSSLGYVRKDADQYLAQILVARGLDAVLKTSANPNDVTTLAAALSQYEYDRNDPVRNELLKQTALIYLDKYREEWLQPIATRINLTPAVSTQLTIRCNDTPAMTDIASWTSEVRSLALSAPMFFQVAIDFHACNFWDRPKVTKPDYSAMRTMNILMVQSQYDSATNTDGANRFFAQLPGARRIYVAGDYQHGVYPNTDTCVDPLVTEYLLGSNFSQREVVCPKLPLDEDAKLLAPDTTLAAVYLNPQRTEQLLDAFKQELIPPYHEDRTDLPVIP